MSHRLKIIFSSCVMSLFALTLISASPVDAGIQVRSSDDLVTQRGGEGPKSLRTPMRSLGTQYAAKKLKEKFKKFGKSVKKAGKKVGKKLGKSKFGKSVIKAGKKYITSQNVQLIVLRMFKGKSPIVVRLQQEVQLMP